MAIRFSKEEQYAVMALVHLGLSNPGKAVQVKEIARVRAIPERFLELILNKLRVAKIVSGKRGPGGGYWLQRQAAEIRLRDVVLALKPPRAEDESTEVLLDICTELTQSYDSVLHRVTLSELCDKATTIEAGQMPLDSVVAEATRPATL